MSSLRRSLALAVATVGIGASVFLAAGSADAHVTVASPAAVQGGYATLTFKVPTESDTASTTELRVQLPSDQPLTSVSVLPMPGWSYHVTKAKLKTPISTEGSSVTEAVSEIDWKADSAATAIKPGEFNQFTISAGPLPKADSMTFKALQSYSDGKVVSWIEQAASGSTAEPEHPAPSLKLSPAASATTASASTGSASTGSASTGSAATGSDATVTAQAAPTADSSSGRATAGVVLGVVGVLLGGLALAMATLRGRRPGASR